jgi:hypothetical protein
MAETKLTSVQVNSLEKMRQMFSAAESCGLPLNDATFMRYIINYMIYMYMYIHIHTCTCGIYIYMNIYIYIYTHVDSRDCSQ